MKKKEKKKRGEKMDKKTNKLILVLSIILIILMIVTSCYAEIKPGDLTNGSVSAEGENELTSLGANIVSVVQTIGVVISVVILLVLGIKYMTGSAEEKADYKKSMIPYLVGAVLIFASTTIVNIVYNLAKGLK